MSLQVWLPLNGNLHNQGLSSIDVSGTTGITYDNNGKIGKAESIKKVHQFAVKDESVTGLHQKANEKT